MATVLVKTILLMVLLAKDIQSRTMSLRKLVAECPYPLPCRCYEDYSGKPDFIVDCSKVKFSSANITQFDKSWTKTIDRLLLDSNNLDRLHNHSFDGLPVVEIFLHDSSITHISTHAFQGAPVLKSLVMWGNRLDGSDFRAFRKLNKLLKLDLSLSDNMFGRLPANTFKGMDSLEELDLGSCGITAIDEEAFSGLKSLKVLKLSGNSNLLEIPLAIKSLVTLHELDLGATEIAIFPKDILSHLSNLKILHLNTNNLSAESIMEDALAGVEDTLEYLDLTGNDLGKVPTFVLRNLRKLKTLRLSSNQISIINPNAFKGMISLENLYLEKNGNAMFLIQPAAFEGLGKTLKHLSLNFNRLSEIPKAGLSSLQKLESLWLNDNQIDDIPSRTFEFQRYLKYLDLSKNNLTVSSFKDDSFAGLGNLQTLILKENSIVAVPSNSFSKIGNLRRLDIGSNSMIAIQPDAFEDLKKLDRLDIGRNPIRFHNNSFRGLEGSLRYLGIGGMGLKSFHLPSMVKLKRLETLDASHNFLENLTQATFSGLNVKSILVMGNSIRYVSNDTFDNLPTPIEVNLQDNDLTSLSFVNNPCKFKQLLVDRNPLTCSCHEYQLSKYQDVRLNASIPISSHRISATCKRPLQLYRQGIRSERFHSISVSMCPGVSEELQICPIGDAAIMSLSINSIIIAVLSCTLWFG